MSFHTLQPLLLTALLSSFFIEHVHALILWDTISNIISIILEVEKGEDQIKKDEKGKG